MIEPPLFVLSKLFRRTNELPFWAYSLIFAVMLLILYFGVRPLVNRFTHNMKVYVAVLCKIFLYTFFLFAGVLVLVAHWLSTGVIMEGRPLRNWLGFRRKPATILKDCKNDKWQKIFCDEYEAICSFADISKKLVLEGAPLDLIEASLQSALQEVGHARLAALRSGGEMVPHQGPSIGSIALGVNSYFDGYLGEGAATDRMRQEAIAENDPELLKVASEEFAHSELGMSIYNWSKSKNYITKFAEKIANARR